MAHNSIISNQGCTILEKNPNCNVYRKKPAIHFAKGSLIRLPTWIGSQLPCLMYVLLLFKCFFSIIWVLGGGHGGRHSTLSPRASNWLGPALTSNCCQLPEHERVPLSYCPDLSKSRASIINHSALLLQETSLPGTNKLKHMPRHSISFRETQKALEGQV